jgi:hypothetical protein
LLALVLPGGASKLSNGPDTPDSILLFFGPNLAEPLPENAVPSALVVLLILIVFAPLFAGSNLASAFF